MIFLPAADVHGLACDVAGLVGGQKNASFGDVFHRSRAAKRVAVFDTLQVGVVVEAEFFGEKFVLPIAQTRGDVVGTNGVYPDAKLAQFNGVGAR